MTVHSNSFCFSTKVAAATASVPSSINMAKEKSEMSETSSERIARLLRKVAAPAVPGEHVTHAIARAARRLGWERGRTKRLWYREARRIDADELLHVERILHREAVDERQQFEARIARLEAIILQIEDEDSAPHHAQRQQPREDHRAVG